MWSQLIPSSTTSLTTRTANRGWSLVTSTEYCKQNLQRSWIKGLRSSKCVGVTIWIPPQHERIIQVQYSLSCFSHLGLNSLPLQREKPKGMATPHRTMALLFALISQGSISRSLRWLQITEPPVSCGKSGLKTSYDCLSILTMTVHLWDFTH